MEAAQWLILIAISAFVIAGIVKYLRDSKARPAHTEEVRTLLPETVTETEEGAEDEPIEDIVEVRRIDFGFSQGFRFAIGFWVGTLLFTVLCATLFGSVIIGAANSLIQQSIQDPQIRR